MIKNHDGKEIKVGDVLNIPVKVLEFSDGRDGVVEVAPINDPRVKYLVSPNVLREGLAKIEVEKVVTKEVEKIVEKVVHKDVPEEVIQKLVSSAMDKVPFTDLALQIGESIFAKIKSKVDDEAKKVAEQPDKAAETKKA